MSWLLFWIMCYFIWTQLLNHVIWWSNSSFYLGNCCGAPKVFAALVFHITRTLISSLHSPFSSAMSGSFFLLVICKSFLNVILFDGRIWSLSSTVCNHQIIDDLLRVLAFILVKSHETNPLYCFAMVKVFEAHKGFGVAGRHLVYGPTIHPTLCSLSS